METITLPGADGLVLTADVDGIARRRSRRKIEPRAGPSRDFRMGGLTARAMPANRGRDAANGPRERA